MVVTVIGAGTIGSAVVHALIQNPNVSQIHVCDARPGTLQSLHAALPASRVRTHEVDARNRTLLRPILHTSKVVINCIASEVSPYLAQLAMDEGIHFCDLGGYREMTRKVMELDEAAKNAGVWLVPNCGVAPGLVNILLIHAINQFDTVQDAYMRVGTIPLHPNPPLNFASYFSAEKLIEEYTEPAFRIEEGKLTTVEPLTGLESILFPEPFGELESFFASGVLAETSPKLTGKLQNLNFKAIRYPNHASQMSFLLALGFAERRLIDVGTHLTYRDILTRRIRKRLGGDMPDAMLLRVLVTGQVDGKDKTLVYQMVEHRHEGENLTAIKRCIGASVAIVASMLATGTITGAGASTPEFIIPTEDFLTQLAQYNLQPEVHWFDGHTAVQHLPA